MHRLASPNAEDVDNVKVEYEPQSIEGIIPPIVEVKDTQASREEDAEGIDAIYRLQATVDMAAAEMGAPNL